MALQLFLFLLRLTFGVALAMACVSSRKVPSGFFKVHLWVLMGLMTLAALVQVSLWESSSHAGARMACCVAAALLGYIGAVCWLYEAKKAGLILLWLVGALALAASLLAISWPASGGLIALTAADLLTGALLPGITLTAMLLGHWHLNAPGMELGPLKKLVLLLIAAVVLRAVVSGIGLGLEASSTEAAFSFWLFIALRWLAGLAGVLLMAILSWHTLKIPNTQSATGILYAAVILVFIGELTGQLLSMNTQFPV